MSSGKISAYIILLCIPVTIMGHCNNLILMSWKNKFLTLKVCKFKKKKKSLGDNVENRGKYYNIKHFVDFSPVSIVSIDSINMRFSNSV